MQPIVSDDKKLVHYGLLAKGMDLHQMYRITYNIRIGSKVPTATDLSVDTFVVGTKTTLTEGCECAERRQQASEKQQL